MSHRVVLALVCVVLASSPTEANETEVNIASEVSSLPSNPRSASARIADVSRDKLEIRLNDSDGQSARLILGRLPTDSATEVRIPVQNSLGEAATFERIETSCGCLAVIDESVQLTPGERSEIRMRIVAPKNEGAFSRSLTAVFKLGASESHRSFVINIVGEARHLFSPKPSVLDLSAGDKKAASTDVLITSNFGDANLKDYTVSVTDRLVESHKVVRKADDSMNLQLVYRDLSTVPFDEWTELLRFTAATGEVLEVPIVLSLKGRYYAKPTSLSVTDTELQEGVRFVIASSDGSPVKLLDSHLLIERDALQNAHSISEVLISKNIGVFRLAIPKLPESLRTDSDMWLRLHVDGQSVPVTIKLIIRERP